MESSKKIYVYNSQKIYIIKLSLKFEILHTIIKIDTELQYRIIILIEKTNFFQIEIKFDNHKKDK